MAKVILICGKICSGKSYYVQLLAGRINAVVLSCDEIMFDLALNDAGEEHDTLVARVKRYLYKKSEEITRAGAEVILDFGFWSKRERDDISHYYSERQITYEWHYIDIADDDWDRNITERNQRVLENLTKAYYLDKGLLMKFSALFEKPSEREMDVWFVNKR